MDRHALKENKEKYKHLKETKKELKDLRESYAYYKKAIKKDTERLLEEQINDRLKFMSVDELSKYKLGIRVTALKKAGFLSIYDLVGYKIHELERIPGIGELSARGIYGLVRQIVNDVNDTTKIVIDNERRTRASDDLVHDLYMFRKLKRLSDEADELLPEVEEVLHRMKKETAPVRSWFAWTFSSEEKKKIAIERFDEIATISDELLTERAEAIFEEEQRALKAKHDEYWGDYTRNAAGYNATLENINENEETTGEGATSTERIAEKNGLPTELAIAISQVPLNLKGLKCELRRYQKFGVQYILNQGAVLLGDDMGLGKTVEAIATMVSLRNNGASHFIVVCPASVLINWTREIHKFSDLEVFSIHGKDSTWLMDKWEQTQGVAVTTYETLSKIDVSADFKFDLLVADEAHYIKNPNAIRTKNLMFFRQHTDRALFMTGTPLENKVAEMIFLIGCLQPRVAEEIKDYKELIFAPQFRKNISGVYFRRTKEDVLEELPQKDEKEEWCELVPQEVAFYRESVKNSNFMSMRQASFMIEDPAVSSKAIRLKELVDDYMEMGRKVLIFSFFINTISQVNQMLGDEYYKCYGPITGSISPAKRQQIIDGFTEHQGGAVLLSQIQAGGTGLNVQAASVIIICEPQLKPSIENQAIARAYRMGQVNKVMVHRLLCEKTVDEQIMNLLKNKQLLFDNFADVSESGQESLVNNEAIKKMVDAEKERYG